MRLAPALDRFVPIPRSAHRLAVRAQCVHCRRVVAGERVVLSCDGRRWSACRVHVAMASAQGERSSRSWASWPRARRRARGGRRSGPVEAVRSATSNVPGSSDRRAASRRAYPYVSEKSSPIPPRPGPLLFESRQPCEQHVYRAAGDGASTRPQRGSCLARDRGSRSAPAAPHEESELRSAFHDRHGARLRRRRSKRLQEQLPRAGAVECPGRCASASGVHWRSAAAEPPDATGPRAHARRRHGARHARRASDARTPDAARLHVERPHERNRRLVRPRRSRRRRSHRGNRLLASQ